MNHRDCIDPVDIFQRLARAARQDEHRVRQVIAKARELKGLDLDDVAALLQNRDPDLDDELFQAAREVRQIIHGKRLGLFAPLYVSNPCSNDCGYCSFRVSDKHVRRRALTQDEISGEVRHLERTGHQSVLVVAGESLPEPGLDYIMKTIETVHARREGKGKIRSVVVNLAPLSSEEFKSLKQCGIGSYQLFQETYHRQTYKHLHPRGARSDFGWRLDAPGRAMAADIDDVGVGILFGLTDHRFEILALLQQGRSLEQNFGVAPQSISVPRLEPAAGSDPASHPPHPVTDHDFKRIVAILRLALPHSGIIMSPRETPRMLAATFALGVTQISAGGRTSPAGYAEGEDAVAGFLLGGHRTGEEVIAEVVRMGYLPCFSAGSHRGESEHFMSPAPSGTSRNFRLSNDILTFKEYLEDHAGPELRKDGLAFIETHIRNIPCPTTRNETQQRLRWIEAGARKLYFAPEGVRT